MSGSGSSYSGTSSVKKDCSSLTIRTKLASPDRRVIDEISIGESLNIVLTPPAGPVTAVTNDGKTAGAILHVDIDSLIECISDGHEYVAKVLEINMGNCEVLIKHR